jgi:hypothetical protein
VILAHVAGMPVEELLVPALLGAGALIARLRLPWRRSERPTRDGSLR